MATISKEDQAALAALPGKRAHLCPDNDMRPIDETCADYVFCRCEFPQDTPIKSVVSKEVHKKFGGRRR